MTESTNNRTYIPSTIAAGLAAVGASVCCIGPLVLLALGIGGTWISYLTAFESYQPLDGSTYLVHNTSGGGGSK